MIITFFLTFKSKVNILQLITRTLIFIPFFIFIFFLIFIFLFFLPFSLFLSLSPPSPFLFFLSPFSARFLELIQTWALLRNAERALALINRITGAAPAGVYSFPRLAMADLQLVYLVLSPFFFLPCCFVALCCDLEDTREWDTAMSYRLSERVLLFFPLLVFFLPSSLLLLAKNPL